MKKKEKEKKKKKKAKKAKHKIIRTILKFYCKLSVILVRF
jgi:hypothetical protein